MKKIAFLAILCLLLIATTGMAYKSYIGCELGACKHPNGNPTLRGSNIFECKTNGCWEQDNALDIWFKRSSDEKCCGTVVCCPRITVEKKNYVEPMKTKMLDTSSSNISFTLTEKTIQLMKARNGGTAVKGSGQFECKKNVCWEYDKSHDLWFKNFKANCCSSIGTNIPPTIVKDVVEPVNN